MDCTYVLIFCVFIFCPASAAFVPLDDLSRCLKHEKVPSSAFVPHNASAQLYQDLNYQLNTFNHIEPAAYIVPTRTAHVQSAVRCLRKLGVPLAVKSGGHSFEKYSFGDNQSVVIDFFKMNKVRINKKKLTAQVDAGALLAQLQYSLLQEKVITPTAQCPTVAFGGAILGGGNGFLGKKFGLMCDNVLEMKMVNAAGQILKIDSRQNQNLFWALRGGAGGNFGIVTKFKLKLYDASNLTYTRIELRYDIDQFSEVFDASQRFFLENIDKSVHVYAGISSHGFIVKIFDVNLSPEDAAKMIQKFPPSKTKSIETFADYVNVFLLESPYDIRTLKQLNEVTRFTAYPSYTKPKTYFVKKVASTAQIAEIQKVLKNNFPAKSKFVWSSEGGKVNSIPKNATAYVHRDSLYYVLVISRSDDANTLAWVNDLHRTLTLIDGGESYQNHHDATMTNYLDRFYGTNLQRLRSIKREVDPDNFFNFPQSIPP